MSKEIALPGPAGCEGGFWAPEGGFTAGSWRFEVLGGETVLSSVAFTLREGWVQEAARDTLGTMNIAQGTSHERSPMRW